MTKLQKAEITNQEICRKFVSLEVKSCFSYEMTAILGASQDQIVGKRGQLEYPLPTWEEVENLNEYKCPECGEPVKDSENDNIKCSACEYTAPDTHFCDETPQEIFEWWIVAEYLYNKLKEKGEPVLEWGNNHYWGRTTTGQAIAMDAVIICICREMEILSGQKYSWEGK